jgi:hypothetical protein
LRPGGEFAAHPEKSVFTALRQVHATDEQRLAILAAFDESQPRLQNLDDEADELMGKWYGLDRRDPGFAKKGAELAEKWGKISRERMALTAKFDGRVATALKQDQWDAWQQFWMRPGFAPAESGPPEEGMRGQRR